MNLVTTPTYGNRILDILATNLHRGYDKAVVLPPIQPDVPGQGADSDHAVAIAKPIADKSRPTGFSRKETRQRRRVTASNLLGLAAFFACFDWRTLHSLVGVDAKLHYLESVTLPAQELYCPMETFVVRMNAAFPVSAKLAKLSALKASEFRANRYSQRFKELRKLAKAEKRFILQRKISEAVSDANGSNSWLSRLEFLLDPDGCTRGEAKTLPEHRDRGLSWLNRRRIMQHT